MRTVKLNDHIFKENLIFFHQNFFSNFCAPVKKYIMIFFPRKDSKLSALLYLKGNICPKKENNYITTVMRLSCFFEI